MHMLAAAAEMALKRPAAWTRPLWDIQRKDTEGNTGLTTDGIVS
jgi:hypothetical protein